MLPAVVPYGGGLVVAVGPGVVGYRNVDLGVELLANGGFDSDTVWSKGTGWTIADGVAVFSGASVAFLSQPVVPVPGGIYRAALTVTAFSSGNVSPRFTGGTQVPGTARTAVGTYTEDMTALDNSAFSLRSGASSSFSVDNVSLVRIG